MSTKEVRHAKVEAFKIEIATVANRNRILKEQTKKLPQLDTIERLKTVVLLQKTAFIAGCESNYQSLINAIRLHGDDKLKATAKQFARKTSLVWVD